MKTIGLTGGIGSGKTTVAHIFETLGVPVFYADEAGRAVLDWDDRVREAVMALIGPGAYANGKAARQVIAQAVFNDAELLTKLNAIVHPAVRKEFDEWRTKLPHHPYHIREAAILYESGSDQGCDAVISVSAPEDVRLERVMQRDGSTAEEVRQRMSRQWSQDEKDQRSAYVIMNDGHQALIPQVLRIHALLNASDAKP